ncbi:hypothetical protein FRC14_004988 [Serendipita sp. 396]|nr:hypothetical protein FRC14_004988 [Serendipita sp. 396]KAG8781242.1 hypothetical protein FRC15_008937 [Serendipita sp. 397]
MESQDIVLEGEDTSQRAVTKLERESGRSLLPVARVQKILKADKELDGIAKEAVFVLSMATERFIMRISEAARSQAGREKRATVQRKDIGMSLNQNSLAYIF